MRNPLRNIAPAKVRRVAYYVYASGSLVMAYLSAKGHVGLDEMALYAGVGGLFGFTAGGNVTEPRRPSDEYPRED